MNDQIEQIEPADAARALSEIGRRREQVIRRASTVPGWYYWAIAVPTTAFAAAKESTRARAVLTAVVIFLVFSSVIVILWIGAQDVLASRMTAGRLSQFLLYSVFAAFQVAY